MRLIDADALFDALNNSGVQFNAEVNRIVLEQPTAYDVEKVVEELYHNKQDYHGDGTWVIDVLNYWEAIDIVKRGGTDVSNR